MIQSTKIGFVKIDYYSLPSRLLLLDQWGHLCHGTETLRRSGTNSKLPIYANKFNTQMVGLIDSLTKVSQEGKSIYEFMQSVKTIIDDLAMIGHNLCDREIVVRTLNGLTNHYKEHKAALHARESPISFEGLVEKLLDYEFSLNRRNPTKVDTLITTQYI